VQDVAEAIIKFTGKLQCGDIAKTISGFSFNPLPIFNIIGLKEISVNETVEKVGQILDKPLELNRVSHRPGQIFRQQINSDRTMAFIDWKPKLDYEQGMRECVEWRKTS
jgi:nucleoside-diphosphate-sugar epimerase